jgi:hypothetical protein
MFTNGSKFLIGATVVTVVAAVMYGVTQEGALGTIGLVSAAIALAFLAGVTIAIRDGNVRPGDELALATCAAAQRAPGASVWPLAGALGVTLVVVGLVTHEAFVIFGIAVIIATVGEWTVQSWSERATADDHANDDIRERIASPLELPVLAAVGIGLLVFAFSRVMLALTKSGTVVAFSVIATLVLVVAGIMASRKKISQGTVAGVCSVAVIALLASGFVAGVEGPREIEEHETTADLAESGRCGVEETEADEKASQTVSAKSNVSATVILREDGTMVATQPGVAGETSTITLPRSNPNNVLFRNESAEERRLVIDAGPIGDTEESNVLCTALVEEGGVQLLTIVFDKPSFAVDAPFEFTVPGVDTATVTVVVP